MSLACVIRIKGFINSYTYCIHIYIIICVCAYICVRTTISRRECWLLLRPRPNPSTSFPAYYSAHTMPFYFTTFFPRPFPYCLGPSRPLIYGCTVLSSRQRVTAFLYINSTRVVYI